MCYRDRCRTAGNVLDDCFAAAVIAKLCENEIDTTNSDETEAEKHQMLQQSENIV